MIRGWGYFFQLVGGIITIIKRIDAHIERKLSQ